MVKCPDCKSELSKPVKTWKYGPFLVEAYVCDKCRTQFREYTRIFTGKHSFTLKVCKGKGRRDSYVKA